MFVKDRTERMRKQTVVLSYCSSMCLEKLKDPVAS